MATNLTLDPFERLHEARGSDEWQENRSSWLLGAAGQQVGRFMQSLAEYPRRQKSFDVDIDAMMGTMYESGSR